MAVSVRQIKGAIAGAGSPNALSFSFDVTVVNGEYCLCLVGTSGAPLSDAPSLFISDDGGNSWVQRVQETRSAAGDTIYCAIYTNTYGSGTKAQNFTISDMAASGYVWGVVAFELEGTGTTFHGNTASAEGAAASSPATAAVTWASPDELLIGITVSETNQSADTPASGFTSAYAAASGQSAPQPSFSAIYKTGVSANLAADWDDTSGADWAAAAIFIKGMPASTSSSPPSPALRLPRTLLTR